MAKLAVTIFKSHTKQNGSKPLRTGCLLSISLALVLVLAVYIFRNPGIAVCAVSSSDQKYSADFTQLISEAKIRIQKTFGVPKSTPIVIFFNDPAVYWPLKLNEYGSTQFIGKKVCVFVGPKGQNIDVVAHELMHAEIAYRVGYWHRLTELPAWFDEGLAMQVDHRARYNLSNGIHTDNESVKKLWYARDFFVDDDEQLTKNYASAKYEVARWVTGVGNNSVYSQLERIKNQESFDAVFKLK